MILLEAEKKARQEVFDYFGYVEGWRVLPFDDATHCWWELDTDSVRFADSVGELEDKEAGQYYENEIYRHLPKRVYEGAEYTMIVVDTRTDGNEFLQIFDNSKRVSNV